MISLILYGFQVDFLDFMKILKNMKKFENIKIGFHGNFKNKSCWELVKEQKTFLLRPPKINISSSRTPWSSETGIFQPKWGGHERFFKQLVHVGCWSCSKTVFASFLEIVSSSRNLMNLKNVATYLLKNSKFRIFFRIFDDFQGFST